MQLFTGRIGRREFWTGIVLLMAVLLPFTDISPLYPFIGKSFIFQLLLLPVIIVWTSSLFIRRANDLEGDLWEKPPLYLKRTSAGAKFHLLLAPTNQQKNKFGPPITRKKNIILRTLGL